MIYSNVAGDFSATPQPNTKRIVFADFPNNVISGDLSAINFVKAEIYSILPSGVVNRLPTTKVQYSAEQGLTLGDMKANFSDGELVAVYIEGRDKGFDEDADAYKTTAGGGGPAADVNVVSPDPLPVQVGNFPATQEVSGSVSVDNFPLSFSIDNFPLSFEVSNFPAFPSSFEVSNFPSFPSSFEVSNLPAIQDVSVQNWPTVQEVSWDIQKPVYFAAPQDVNIANSPSVSVSGFVKVHFDGAAQPVTVENSVQVTGITNPVQVAGITAAVPILEKTYTRSGSIGSATSAVVKTSAAKVISVFASSTSPNARYLMLHNKTTAVQVNDAPLYVFPIPSGQVEGAGALVIGTDFFGPGGAAFSTGLAWSVSSSPINHQTGATSTEHNVFIHYDPA